MAAKPTYVGLNGVAGPPVRPERRRPERAPPRDLADQSDGYHSDNLDEGAHAVAQGGEANTLFLSSGGSAWVRLCQSAGGILKGEVKTKVFLRNRATGQFYAGLNVWSGSASVAHEFDTVENASRLARKRGLAGMEVVVRGDGSDGDLILPLRPRT